MRKALRIICGIIVLVCMVVFSTLAAGETLTCIVKETQYVNIRSRASDKATMLGKLHNGDTIEPVNVENGFIEFVWNQKQAFVSVKYFEIQLDAPTDYIVTANGRVRLRETPGGDPVGWIQPDTVVTVRGWRYSADGTLWAKVSGPQYIMAEYLDYYDNVTHPDNPAPATGGKW